MGLRLQHCTPSLQGSALPLHPARCTPCCFLRADSKLSETRTMGAQWAAHVTANRVFAEVALRHYQDGDIVWVQDYHLMLLPAILKDTKPRMKVRRVGWGRGAGRRSCWRLVRRCRSRDQLACLGCGHHRRL